MGLVQALPPLAAGAPPGIDAAVATCLGLLDAPGLAAGGRRGAARVLCEGAPRAGSMPAFLGSLRGALGAASSGDVAHLPLGELIWELPEHGPAGGRTLRRLLAGFVESALAASSSSRLLVLWALDGPFPGSASAWLRDACGPLRSLPASCALLGLCASRARVPAALRELFDGGDRAAPEASQDLGLGPPPAAAAAVAGDEGERGSPPVVIGAGAALGDLRANVLNYYQHPGVFKAMGVAWPPRVLLHGPPGSGKTLVLQWLCAQVPARVRSTWLRPGEVWSRYLGESEERLRAAFAAAAEGAAAAGALLLLEGIDELVPGPSVPRRRRARRLPRPPRGHPAGLPRRHRRPRRGGWGPRARRGGHLARGRRGPGSAHHSAGPHGPLDPPRAPGGAGAAPAAETLRGRGGPGRRGRGRRPAPRPGPGGAGRAGGAHRGVQRRGAAAGRHQGVGRPASRKQAAALAVPSSDEEGL
ncbi:unnamed protein product [Prorocentrum cordatum]|uniref:ATPase AAA-type core domain-containing protein n=1 Tax=Prorocentrum cordatum TaxID=2364126 RepID=A0ABN9WZ59_9DINO|nr:unnamed protein product [Polarella glacialis]